MYVSHRKLAINFAWVDIQNIPADCTERYPTRAFRTGNVFVSPLILEVAEELEFHKHRDTAGQQRQSNTIDEVKAIRVEEHAHDCLRES